MLVALVHRPSQAERATDLRGFLTDVTADIQSCAGGVGESLTALQPGAVREPAQRRAVTRSTSRSTGAANCSPANNELLDDLEEYQVTESLASFRLKSAVASGLVDLGSARRPAGAD